MTTPPVDRRALITGGAALALGACATAPPSNWTPPPAQTFRVVEHEWIPMRDGVRLSARIWIPESNKTPAVLEYIPYRKRDLYRPYDDTAGAMLAAGGVAFVRLDVRGSGDSEGAIDDEYSEAELEDCEQAIAWIARQPWCTGAVGMRGMSWGGINTLQVAARRPPALKAIMPMACCDNRYTDDAHYIGGALGRTNFQWGVLFKVVMAGPPDPQIVGDSWEAMWRQRLDATPAILERWTRHQREDAYWRRGSVSFDPGDIAVPAYLVSGWSDTYAVPVLRLLDTLKTPSKALIGPWGHTYPYTASQGLAWSTEELRWWRHWLMDEPTGIMDEPRLRAFMPYSTASEGEAAGKPIPGRWIAEKTWPPPSRNRRFHLAPGRLADSPQRGDPIAVRDKGVVGTTKPEWLDRLPIEQSHDDTLSSLFDSEPLPAPLEIFGSPRLKLRIAADKPVASLMLRLCEVRPDGKSWLVTWAALNLTRRRSMATPEPLEPGRFYDVDIDIRAIAHRFSAGSRIRLAVSEGFWPMLWPSPEKPTLQLSDATLDLPVRAPETSPAPFPITETNSPPDPLPPYRPSSPNAEGRIVLSSAGPSMTYTVPGPDIELQRYREESAEIDTANPASSRWRQKVRSGWRRGDWSCEVEATYDLTSTPTTFRLTETLRAVHNGREIFARDNTADIPRDLM